MCVVSVRVVCRGTAASSSFRPDPEMHLYLHSLIKCYEVLKILFISSLKTGVAVSAVAVYHPEGLF